MLDAMGIGYLHVTFILVVGRGPCGVGRMHGQLKVTTLLRINTSYEV